MENYKNFIITTKRNFNFIINVFGMAISSSLRFLTNNTINVTYILGSIVKNSTNIAITTVSVSISNIVLSIRDVFALDIGTITSSYAISLYSKIVSDIDLVVIVEPIMSLATRAISAINLPAIDFVFTPIIGAFNSLGDFDAENLGTLDIIDLGDMDVTLT